MSRTYSIPPWVIPVVLFSLFGSFGPIPWASSEGFLVTFTPGPWRIRYLPLRLFSEYSSYGSHRVLGFIASQPPSGSLPSRTETSPQRGKVCSVRSEPSPGVKAATPEGSLQHLGRYRGGSHRNNAMNPRTRGILETLNPTDEALR